MKNTLFNLLMILAFTLMTAGVVWLIILEIIAWNIPMTKIQQLIYTWKPVVMILIGALIVHLTKEVKTF